MISQKNYFLRKQSYIFYEYYKQQKNLLELFFCSKNWLGLVIFITKYVVISAKESANTNAKREKFSGILQNEVKMVIFVCENASFDSMNSNQAENRRFNNRTLKKNVNRWFVTIFYSANFWDAFSTLILSVRSIFTFLIKCLSL